MALSQNQLIVRHRPDGRFHFKPCSLDRTKSPTSVSDLIASVASRVRADENWDLLAVLPNVSGKLLELLPIFVKPVNYRRSVNEIRIKIGKRLRFQELNRTRNSADCSTWSILRRDEIPDP